MAQSKFSEFTSKSFDQIKSDLISTTIYLVGVDESNSVNFKINYLQLFATASNTGSTGASVFKDITNLKQFNFRKIKAGSDKVTVTQNTLDISVDVNPTNINIGDLSGDLPIDQGGLGGIDPDPLTEDSLLFYDISAGEYAFLSLGSGLVIEGGAINCISSSPLTTKGDLLGNNGTADIRVPVGANGTILEADSSIAAGFKWSEYDLTSLGKVRIDEVSDAAYLKDIIISGNGLNVTSDAGVLGLNLVPSEINISELNNDAGFVGYTGDDLVLTGAIKTSNTNLTEIAQPWELGSAAAGTVGGTATALQVSVNGVMYYITAGTSIG